MANKEFAMENGKPGYIINGKFHPIPKSEWGKQQFKDDLARYEKARGADQLRKDSEKVRNLKKFAMENGKPGYIINGKFHPIPKSEWGKKQFKDDLARYERERGAEQLKKDSEKVERNKNPDPKPDDPKPDDPKQEQDPPRQDPPKPRQTAQQKAGLPASVPAAFVPDVSEYQKARQRAVASGDQKQMDKVRDSGMAIWAKLYGPGGKKELKYPTDRQKEIFKRFPNNTTPQTNSQSSIKQSQGQSQNQTKGPQRLQVVAYKEERQMEPYDLVLEYLLSEGHADTLDEANYIMLKLDGQSMRTIVEMVMPDRIDPMKHKAAQKTQKIYNKAKGGAGSEKDFLKRTGVQLPEV